MAKWTADELQLLKEKWPGIGYHGCKDLFPSRTKQAVATKAWLLGLKGPHSPEYSPPHEFPEIRDSEKAYFAGFMDGEGYIGAYVCSSHKRPKMAVSIHQRDPRPLQELKRCYGGILVHRSRKHLPNYSDIYLWQLCTYRTIERLLSDIRPFAIVKRDQIDLALAMLEIRNGKRVGDRYSVEEHLKVVELSARLKHKNRRSVSWGS